MFTTTEGSTCPICYIQVFTLGFSLTPNVWYSIVLAGLGQEELSATVNGDPVQINVITSFTGVDFNALDGPLYIGGIPSAGDAEV